MNRGSLDYEQIYTEFQPKIYRYLVRIVGERVAEDLTQEVFIKISNGLGSFKNESKLSTWIYQIATNAATDNLRSRAHKEQALEESGEDLVGCADSSSTVEHDLERKEMGECIRAYVDMLPETYRIVIILSELEEFKNGEIAAILGISIDAVKIRLHRARQKLKELLAKNCLFYKTDCNTLACEPKGAIPKRIKPLPGKKID